jgi:hypothetical protein
MYNRIIKLGTFIALSVLALLAVTAFAQPQFASAQAPEVVSTTVLTPEESAALIYMREEEKLARDVYTALYDQYGLRIFSNISGAEAQHMSAVKVLLDRYGVADPAEGKAVGEFTNPELQALYDQLVAEGSKSLQDALQVGVTIEKTDIQDLEERLDGTDQWDIQRVFGNLLRGSNNHLRAFSRFVN